MRRMTTKIALDKVFFYLLNYVTSTEIFQIGNRKKKKTWTFFTVTFAQPLRSLPKLSEVSKIIIFQSTLMKPKHAVS